jgi:hypothetical protein
VKEAREYVPNTTIAITAGVASSAFQLVNNSSGPKKYVFTCSAPGAFIRRGFSDVSAATATDHRLITGAMLYLALSPGEGVRVIRNGGADATVYIGDLSV